MRPDRPVKTKKKARAPRPADDAAVSAETPVIDDKGIAPRKDAPLPQTRPASIDALVRRILAPQPILRIELIRIVAPLATLGFMAPRLAHADEWLTTVGFQVPKMLDPDYRQPFYLEPISTSAAWLLAAVMIASGLAVAAGYRARIAAVIFAATLAYVALADRLAAFTVSKLSPAVMLGLAASPIGRRFSVDAWLARKKDPKAPLPTLVAAGGPLFFQLLIPVFYNGSALAKAKGDWLKHNLVLWSHVHDSYQTAFSWALANALPAWLWTALQWVVLALEMGAPIWFVLKRTRTTALVLAVGMHAMIGLMFWPVRWFSLLMISILCGAFLPEEWLDRAVRKTTRM
jgi:hypothetical protein